MLIVSIFICILAGCKKEPDLSQRSEFLTSTVWDNTVSCGTPSTESGLYTCIFEPNGIWRSYFKVFETAMYNWRLTDYFTLSINNINSTITELNSGNLVMEGPGGSFLGLFDFDCEYKYKALPVTNVTSVGVSRLSNTSARLHGYLRTCEETSVSVEYGISSGYGSSTPMTGNPVQGVANRVVEITLNGLLPETTYHYRFKAVTPTGTRYGINRKFRTYDASSLADIDGNEYNTVTIGSQVWMAEPLRTIHYNDGSPIPLVADSLEWVDLESPGYCWYKNDPVTYKKSYGALYNWYAVNTGILCPTGWHVPEKQEWVDLIDYLGADAGDRLTQGHYDFGQGIAFLESSNESGFSAVMTARRLDHGFILYEDSDFWSASEEDPDNGRIFITNSFNATTIAFLKDSGLPVRCIKD